MDFNQLGYFQTIAKLNNMSRAAEKLHISQPALSKSLQILEQELGYQLFDRRGRHIILNDNGRTVFKYTETMLLAWENMKKELENNNNTREKTHLMIFDQTNSQLVLQLITNFKKKYPQTTFYISRSEFLPNDVHLERAISAKAFFIATEASEELKQKSVRLLTEEFVIGFPIEHPMAGRKSVSLVELASEKFVSMSHLSPLRDVTDQFCHEAGFTCMSSIECSEWHSIHELVSCGVGIGFFPRYSWFPLEETQTISFAAIRKPRCTRSIFLSWSSDLLSDVEKRFISSAKEFFAPYDA